MTDRPAVRTAGEIGLREEWFLGVSVATSLIFLAFPEQLFRRLPDPLWFAVVFGWLFAVVLAPPYLSSGTRITWPSG